LLKLNKFSKSYFASYSLKILLKYNSIEYDIGEQKLTNFIKLFAFFVETNDPHPTAKKLIAANPVTKALVSLSNIAPQACPRVVAFIL